MLPSAALMPPCAATVWLRVGNTLLMHAVLRPCSARPKVARKSGAAGADDDDVVRMIGERVIRSGHAWAPNAMRNTARMPIRAATTSANLSATSTTRRVPLSLM